MTLAPPITDDVLVARGRPGPGDGVGHSPGHEAEPGREPHLGGRLVGDDVQHPGVDRLAADAEAVLLLAPRAVTYPSSDIEMSAITLPMLSPPGLLLPPG